MNVVRIVFPKFIIDELVAMSDGDIGTHVKNALFRAAAIIAVTVVNYIIAAAGNAAQPSS